MTEEKKPKVEDTLQDHDDLLASQDELFAHFLQETDKPVMRKSVIIAFLIHAFVISITIPQVNLPSLPKSTKPVIVVRKWRPPPPPKKQRPERPKVEQVLTKKVPIPDLTPDDPEPIVEPEPPPEDFLDIPLDADILIGAPEPPPATDGILFAGVGGVTNPEKIHDFRPSYPDIARKAKIEGDVILQAIIRADGTVGDVAVLKSPGAKFGFDDEAIRAVRQWRYKPALQGGKAVDVYFTVVVKFYLED